MQRAHARGAGTAVTSARLPHHTRARRRSALGGAVGRAVVDDDHLIDLLRPHLAHDIGDRRLLIETRDNDADHLVDRGKVHGSGRGRSRAHEGPRRRRLCAGDCGEGWTLAGKLGLEHA